MKSLLFVSMYLVTIAATSNVGFETFAGSGAYADEHVILRCGSSSFQVDIPNYLIGGTYNPKNLRLSYGSNNKRCKGFQNGAMYISLNSSYTACGTRLNDTGSQILYENKVEINPSDGNSVVDFLGLEITITCEYSSSERIRTHFKTITDIIRKKAKGSFEFDFAMYTDQTFAARYPTFPVETRLNKTLYFRAKLLKSAGDLKIRLRSCRATPSPDYDNENRYKFIIDGCGVRNAPVQVLIPHRPTQADFKITSFRFRSDLGSPHSKVWVHCEVVVCDVNDLNSECYEDCKESRHRRSVEDLPLKAKRIVQGPILLKSDAKSESEKLTRTEKNNGSLEIFTIVLSVVSLVMLFGFVVMAITLGRVMRNQFRSQPVPNPSGSANSYTVPG